MLVGCSVAAAFRACSFPFALFTRLFSDLFFLYASPCLYSDADAFLAWGVDRSQWIVAVLTGLGLALVSPEGPWRGVTVGLGVAEASKRGIDMKG